MAVPGSGTRHVVLAAWLVALAGLGQGSCSAAAPDPLGGWHRQLPVWEVHLPDPNAWDLYLRAAELCERFPPSAQGSSEGHKHASEREEMREAMKASLTGNRTERFDPSEFARAVFAGDESRIHELRPTLEADIALNQPALDLLHEARALDCMRPRPTDPIVVDFPTGARFRELARVQAGRMALLHLDGHDDEALGVAEDTLALGIGIGRGGGIIDDMVGGAVVAITTHTSLSVLTGDPKVTPERLREHALILRRFREQRWPISRVLHLEGDGMLRTFANLPADLDRAVADAEASSKSRGGDGDRLPLLRRLFPWADGDLLRFIAGLFADADAVAGNTGADDEEDRIREAREDRDRELAALPRLLAWLDAYYVELVAATDKPSWEIDLSKLDARVEAEASQIAFPGDGEPSTIADILPSTARFVENRKSCDAPISGEEIAALLSAYRMDRGEYPASLAGLVPGYTDAIPPDPWTGKPLLYRLESPTDYVLYCTGADKVDNGGAGPAWSRTGADYVLVRARPTELPRPAL